MNRKYIFLFILVIIFIFVWKYIFVKNPNDIILGDIAVLYGDVNNDSKINSLDYILVRKHLLQIELLKADQLARADVNRDSKVGSLDYIIIRKMLLGEYTIDVENITLNKTKETLSVGKITELKATITPSNAINKTITWTSSNTKIASVDKNGKVTAKSEGKTVITAKIDSVKAEYIVTVEAKTTTEYCDSLYNSGVKTIDYLPFIKKFPNSDDYYAIKAAHECANKYNLPVEVTKGEYNIYKNANYDLGDIAIKTNTNLNNSTIFIHDEKNVMYSQSKNRQTLFRIAPSDICVTKEMSLKNLKQGSVVSELAGSSNGKFVKVYDQNHTVFIRSYNNGNKRNDGEVATDSFRVDSKGKILDPFFWTYSNDKRKVYMCDIPSNTLTFKNAYIYNIVDSNVSATTKYDISSYARRGLVVTRSNVVINNVVHGYLKSKNKNDLATTINYAYYGFFIIQNVANVTLKNSRLYALDSNYQNSSGASTYDLILEDVVNVLVDNVVLYDYYDDGKLTYFNNMNNQFNDTKYWPVSASNRTKNVTWNNCYLNRIDGVHAGKINSTIKNSKAGRCITMLGKGDFIISNVAVYNSNEFMCLRDEYGQTWNGNLIINNARLYPRNNKDAFIINMGVTYGNDGYVFNNGYDLYLPKINVSQFKAYTNGNVYVFNNSESNTGKIKGDLRKVKDYIRDNKFTFNYTKKQDIKLNNIYNNKSLVSAKNYLINFGEN